MNRSEKSNRLDKELISMYVVDGIAYAGEPEPVIKVNGIRAMDDYNDKRMLKA